MTNERRRTTRVAIMGRLHGVAVSLDIPVKVQDLSLGGMAIETSVAFPVGAVHEFEVTLGDGSSVLLRGRVMHCRTISAPDVTPLYATGIQFVEDEPTENADIGDIIDKLT
jgi:hypothetical protein